MIAPGLDLYTRVQSWYNKGLPTELLAFEPMDWDARLTLLSVMSAANTLAIMLLVGVVTLQVSEWYVEEQYTLEIEQEKKARIEAQRIAQAKLIEITDEKKKN